MITNFSDSTLLLTLILYFHCFSLFQINMASPQKNKLDTLEQSIVDSFKDLDIQLKAACFDLTNCNNQAAIETIDKARRKLRAIEGKSVVVINLLRKDHALQQQKMHGMASRERFLMKDIHDLRHKKTLLATLGITYDYTCYPDPSTILLCYLLRTLHPHVDPHSSL